MTQNDYLLKNLTKWDRFKANCYFAPVAWLIIIILIQMFGFLDMDIPREYVIIKRLVAIWVVMFAIVVPLRITYAKKVARLMADWERKYGNGSMDTREG